MIASLIVALTALAFWPGEKKSPAPKDGDIHPKTGLRWSSFDGAWTGKGVKP